VLQANDETSHENLALARPHTPHRRVAEGKGRMDPIRPAFQHAAQSGYDAVNVVNDTFWVVEGGGCTPVGPNDPTPEQ